MRKHSPSSSTCSSRGRLARKFVQLARFDTRYYARQTQQVPRQ